MSVDLLKRGSTSPSGHVFDVGLLCPSQFSHLAWIQTDRKAGGLGDLNYPLVADLTKSITKAYDVMIEDEVS